MNAEDQNAGHKEEHRNLLKVLHSALQETDRCAGYAPEAEETGNERFAIFFREVQMTYTRVAERTEEMLGVREDGAQSNVRSKANPAQGDPGDVTSGHDVVSPA